MEEELPSLIYKSTLMMIMCMWYLDSASAAMEESLMLGVVILVKKKACELELVLFSCCCFKLF
jgi:hypothetical protein